MSLCQWATVAMPTQPSGAGAAPCTWWRPLLPLLSHLVATCAHKFQVTRILLRLCRAPGLPCWRHHLDLAKGLAPITCLSLLQVPGKQMTT